MTRDHALLKWRYRPAIARPLRYARRLAAMSPRELVSRLAPAGVPSAPPPGRLSPPVFLFDAAEARRLSEPTPFAPMAPVCWEIFGVAVRLEPGELDWHRGDTRWVWELNRHQFLFPLARMSLLTGDPAGPRLITALLEDWWRNNPFGCGVNWVSALEVAIRSISWLWTIPLLLGSLEDAFLDHWLASLAQHYQYLTRRLSVYTDPDNHLIGEAAALWMLSVALPGLPGAVRQERRALAILAREIERQVTPDGVGREQSTGYLRFILDFYRQVLALARRTGRGLPAVIAERVTSIFGFLATVGDASIGDCDDGRGLPFVGSEADLTAWLGEDARAAPARQGFFKGGYCYWESGGMGVLFDVGPLGLWPNASHGHADALSLQVRINGRWLLGDPGTGAYAACPWVRDALRGTAAHNTVTVDRLDQADPLDVFKWLSPAPARLLEIHSGEGYDFAAGAHQGYRRLASPVTHCRRVRFQHSPPTCVVLDVLEGTGRHHCAQRFHFPPEIELREESPDRVLALDPSGAGLQLRLSGPARRERSLWSRRFGQWETAPVLVVESTAELPLEWLTVVRPAEQ